MPTDRSRAWITSIGISAFVVILVVIALSPLRGLFGSPERLREVVRSYEVLGPAVIILIQIVQVIVAPIPGQAIDLANGYLFGWFAGSVFSLTGIVLGSTIAIWLANRFGRPLVKRLLTPKGLDQIQPYIRRRNQWFFFFLFLLPGTPDDVLCFAIGLSSIPFWRAVAIALLGRAPGVVATVIAGHTGQSLNPITFTLIATAVSIVMFVVVWKTPLGRAMKLPPENDKRQHR
ncbi:MAG: TVP38/TMEM64 family protein [Candidatus Kerfeldbacteria bacterium]|nr:TVP38/TMEM64 family protein [Candidatus Kerfeldbacteria bacterium]